MYRAVKWALMSCLWAGAVAAQNAGQIEIKAQGVVVRFEPPPWSTSATLNETSDVFRQEGKGAAGDDLISWLALPKGDAPEAWTRIYGVLAEHPVTGEFESYVAGEGRVFAQTCTASAPFFDRRLSDQARLMILYCAERVDHPGKGEVAIFKMERMGDVLVKVYQHFRVPAFDLNDVERRPPVALDVLRAGMVRVGRMSLEVAD